MKRIALAFSLTLTLTLTLALARSAFAAVTLPIPLVSQDASTLPVGDLLVWYNMGSLGGYFVELGSPPQVQIVAGRKAVTFNGVNGFRSTYACPSVLTGNNPFTVSLWALSPNPAHGDNQWIVSWTRNSGIPNQVAAFGLGKSLSSGAVSHGGGEDLGWDRGVPSQGVWHNIIVAWSGASAWERVYLDGVPVSVRQRSAPLDIPDIGYPFLLGVTDSPDSFSQNFVGSISSLKIWAQELTTDQILAEYYFTTLPNQAPLVPPLVNPSFELPRAWAPNAPLDDNRSLPGWGIAVTTATSRATATGIGTCGANLNNNPSGSPWDNGIAPDGRRVLAIAGTASGGQGVSQWLYLYSGRTYRLHLAYNARTGGHPVLKVSVNGAPLAGMPVTVAPAEAAGSFTKPFAVFDADFTVPRKDFYPLQIDQTSSGAANVLLLDDVRLMAANSPQPVRCDQAGGIDFGVVGKNSVNDTSLTLHNLAAATLNFGPNYGAVTNNYGWNITGPDAASFSLGFWDSSSPAVFTPCAPNSTLLSIVGWKDALGPVMRFTPGTAMKTYQATLNLTFSNGTYAGILAIPLRGTIAAAPVVLNGSFEQSKTADNGGYASGVSLCPYAYYDLLGDGVAIPNWLVQGADGGWHAIGADGIGVEDRENAARFINQGTLPDGRQGLYIQTLADSPATNPDGSASAAAWGAWSPRTRTVRQYLGGFVPGHSYKITLWVGARNAGTSRASLGVALDDRPLTVTNIFNNPNITVTGTSATLTTGASFTRLEFDAVATREGPLPLDISAYTRRDAIGNRWVGDSTLTIDKVQIFDLADTRPAANPMVRSVISDPATNTYYAARNFLWSAQQHPLTYYCTYRTTAGPLTFTIFNKGGGPLDVTGIEFEGVYSRHWSALPARLEGIPPCGGSATLDVYFNPKDVGNLPANLVLTTNDTTGTYKIPLQGISYGGPVIYNSSFENPPVYWANDAIGVDPDNAWVWRSQGSKVVPAYWTITGPGYYAGVSPQMDAGWINNGSTFQVTNGMITQGNQALWLRSSTVSSGIGDRTARQTVYGFQKDTRYHFRVWANARAMGDNKANFLLRISDPLRDNAIVAVVIDASNYDTYGAPFTAVDSINEFIHPYQLLEGDFTAPWTQQYNVDLFAPFNPDDSTLMIDNVDIQNPFWGSVKQWEMYR